MKNILITTGGTGGHVIPSVSLFDHLQNSFSVKIVTDKRGSKYIDENKYSYELIDVPNLFIKIYLLPLMMLKYLIIILKSINFIRRITPAKPLPFSYCYKVIFYMIWFSFVIHNYVSASFLNKK